MTTAMSKPKSGLKTKKRKDLIFYICLVAIPFTQFCIFYIAVNINSILMAFQKYDSGSYVFSGFSNFERIWAELSHSKVLLVAFKNSFILYAVGLLIGVTLGLLFSFYIYKKLPLGNFFKIMLFLPSIISAMVMALMFLYFCNEAIPGFFRSVFKKEIPPLLSVPDNLLGLHIFYAVFVSFGPSMLMYVGAMGNISDSVVESARIEGASIFQEFRHITLPLIYPTMTTFIVVGVAGLFTNQMHLYAFYGGGADITVQTLGYYLFKGVFSGSLSVRELPYYAALGLALTFVAAPLTLTVKFLMEKLGPSAN